MVYIQAQYFPLLLYMKGDAYEEHFYFSFFTLRFYCIEVTKQYNSKALVEIHFCSFWFSSSWTFILLFEILWVFYYVYYLKDCGLWCFCHFV